MNFDIPLTFGLCPLTLVNNMRHVITLLVENEFGVLTRVAGLFSPFTILDGVRVWLGGNAQTGLVADPGRYGPLYGVVAVLVLAACLGGLAARYRKASQS